MKGPYAFNPAQGLNIVSVKLYGPTGDTYARLALDTGATSTTVRTAILVSIGYDLSTSPIRTQLTTASGIEFAPRLAVDKIEALGLECLNFTLISPTLPPSASVDGLLGLDFLRGQLLTIDFRNGQVTLS